MVISWFLRPARTQTLRVRYWLFLEVLLVSVGGLYYVYIILGK